jgi:outer membrane protein assembly factor BamB
MVVAAAGALILLVASQAMAQDWPQWRGPDRNGKIADFKAPATWPKMLAQKWKVTVGSGDSSPVLVGDKVYVFARQGEDEVTWCLNAADGKEVWHVKEPVPAITGASARQHSGPRATPAVADGKIITLGVTGILACLNTADHSLVWRKEDFKGTPKFYTSSSPLAADGLAIAQLGPEGTGVIAAFDLAGGAEKWKCPNEGAAYASPVLMTVGGVKQVVTLTDKNLIGLALADGKLLWQTPFAAGYNAATPVVDGSTVIVSGVGRGTKAFQIDKKGDAFEAKDLWSSTLGVQFCTPLLKEGFVYGITDKGNLFCLDAKNGETVWTDSAKVGNFGALLDATSAVLALPNTGEMLVIKPGEKQYTELARYKVADSQTYACPIVSGNRIFVKDQESLILWTLE